MCLRDTFKSMPATLWLKQKWGDIDRINSYENIKNRQIIILNILKVLIIENTETVFKEYIMSDCISKGFVAKGFAKWEK